MTDVADVAEMEMIAAGGETPGAEQGAEAEKARKAFEDWYWQVRTLARRYSAERGPEAFRAYLSLAAIALNTACCTTARREDDPAAEGGYRWVDEPGIAPLHKELAQAANELLRLLQKELERVGPDGAVR